MPAFAAAVSAELMMLVTSSQVGGRGICSHCVVLATSPSWL
jgi:hypothetical protein